MAALLIVALATFAPAVWYRHEIDFAPDKFVEEWIKFVATTIVVALLVEVIVARRERFAAVSAADEAISRDYVQRVDTAIRHLRMLQTLATDDLAEQDRISAAAHRVWCELLDRYHSDFVLNTPAHLSGRRVAAIRQANLSSCANLIEVALSANNDRAKLCDDAIAGLADVRAAFTYAETSTS